MSCRPPAATSRARATLFPIVSVDPLLNVVRALAGAELDNAKIGETVDVEGILADDFFDLPSILPHRQNDSARPRNLPARDEEVACRVVLLQESHVRRHLRVDLGQVSLVGQFDDEHWSWSGESAPCSFPRRRRLQSLER